MKEIISNLENKIGPTLKIWTSECLWDSVKIYWVSFNVASLKKFSGAFWLIFRGFALNLKDSHWFKFRVYLAAPTLSGVGKKGDHRSCNPSISGRWIFLSAYGGPPASPDIGSSDWQVSLPKLFRSCSVFWLAEFCFLTDTSWTPIAYCTNLSFRLPSRCSGVHLNAF